MRNICFPFNMPGESRRDWLLKKKKMLPLLFFISLCVCFVNSQNSWNCDPNYCRLKGECTPLNCEEGRVVKNATQCGCCDICIRNLKLGDECVTWNYDIEAVKECGPGLICNKTEGIRGECVQSDCLRKYEKERHDYSNYFKVNFECDDLGNFGPVACIEGVLCFCVDKKGKRIFGTDFSINNDTMKCDCSRDVSDFPREVDVENFPRCLGDGNYDPLQCVGEKCFCMGPGSFHDADDNDLVAMDKLGCHDRDRHKNERKTDCLVKRSTFRKENLTTVAVDHTRCDLDGSYSPAQPQERSYSCVSSTGQKLNDPKGEETKDSITCRCLRDKEMVQNSAKDVISPENKQNFEKIDCIDPAKSNKILHQSFFEDFMK